MSPLENTSLGGWRVGSAVKKPMLFLLRTGIWFLAPMWLIITAHFSSSGELMYTADLWTLDTYMMHVNTCRPSYIK